MVSEKTFPSTIAGLDECQKFLASLCESPKPQIIMDEIVSNIVRCSGATEFTIQCECKSPDGVVTMKFIDNGKAFDPTTEVAEPDITATAANRNIGGLGIFMVRKLSKALEYCREGDKNILSVTL